jgi:hypothetical protein
MIFEVEYFSLPGIHREIARNAHFVRRALPASRKFGQATASGCGLAAPIHALTFDHG